MSLTSSQITQVAKLMLSHLGAYVWRHNQLRVPGRSFIGEPGCSDLIGYNVNTGQFVACEVKAKGDSLSDDQKAFLRNVKNGNGIALMAIEGKGGNVEVIDYEVYLASLKS